MNKEILWVDPNHHISINNSIQSEIGVFFNKLNKLLDKNTMVDLMHQEAVNKDLKNTLEILEIESKKIGIKPEELMEWVNDFTKEKPIARGFAALMFNMKGMMSFSPDFLDNITIEKFTKIMEERVTKNNYRREIISSWFDKLSTVDFTHITHPKIIQHIQAIYSQCRKNMMKVEQDIIDRTNDLEKRLSKWIKKDIKRWWEMYRRCGRDELDQTLEELYKERKIWDNEMVDIIEWVVMIYFFNRDHYIKNIYSTVLLEKIWDFIKKRDDRFWWEFYDDFKYLRQEYGYQILMYDSDYAVYEHSMIIKNQIENLLEKNKLYILRPPVEYEQKQ